MSHSTDLSAILLEGRRTSPAVFAVEHRPSGRRLVVATLNLSKRLHDQQRYLREGRHHNPLLAADLSQDGADAFQIVLLELVDDPKFLRPLKLIHAEEARKGSGCYNAEEPRGKRPTAMMDQKLMTQRLLELRDRLERHRAEGPVQSRNERVDTLLESVRQALRRPGTS